MGLLLVLNYKLQGIYFMAVLLPGFFDARLQELHTLLQRPVLPRLPGAVETEKEQEEQEEEEGSLELKIAGLVLHFLLV